jgi:subtilisin-like proprotein convertase family protein
VILSDAGSGGGVDSVVDDATITLNDDATASLPRFGGAVRSGTYRPADVDPNTDPFPGPAPSAPAGGWTSSLSVFNGVDSGGTWSLYVVDDSAAGGTAGGGTIAGGWELTLWLDPLTAANAAAITVGDADPKPTPAGPYPSAVAVPPTFGSTVRKVAVTLTGLRHTFAGDVDMLLVAPGGRAALILSDAGEGVDGATVTLDDEGTAVPVAGVLTGGVFRPTNYDGSDADAFPAPAPPKPAGGWATDLSAFRGIDPSGNWRLFVADDDPGAAGMIAGGWALTLWLNPRPSTGANANAITIKDGAGAGPTAAAPYPSTIDVTLAADRLVTHAAVTLHGFGHSSPGDVDVLLVGPRGQSVLLMSDAGAGGGPASNLTLTFDDAAAATLPAAAALSGGVFRPTNHGAGADTFPAPAPGVPAGGWATSLSAFNGSFARGAWSLYVLDDADAGTGSIAGGWSLTLLTTAPPGPPSAPDLAAASDSGIRDTDDLTNDATPTFGGTAAPGSTVSLIDSGAREVGSGVAVNGRYAITVNAPLSADGAHSVSVRTVVGGTLTMAAEDRSVTLDTTAPAATPPAPDLQPNSDFGVSDVDNITWLAVLTFDIPAAAANPFYRVDVDGVPTPGFGYETDPTFSTGLDNGVYSFALRSLDAAGNASAPSPALDVTIDSVSPVVTEVLVAGTAWTPGFLNLLQTSGLGGAGGFAVPDAAAQLLALPFSNLDRISVRFNEDVAVHKTDLSVTGMNAAGPYPFAAGAAGFAYNAATRTANWTLAAAVGRDKLLLHLLDGGFFDPSVLTDVAGNPLDGEWTNGAGSFPSGDGAAGGDFRFRLNVAPGDADGSGTVDVTDLGALATNFNQSPRGPRLGDFNGDARVDVSDLGVLATNFNRTLPAGSPSSVTRRPTPATHLRLSRGPVSMFHTAWRVGPADEETAGSCRVYR